MVCDPSLAWNWYVLDFAYVLTLIGGTLILRAKTAMPLTWIAFGVLSACVGGLLFFETYNVQLLMATPVEGGAMAALTQTSC